MERNPDNEIAQIEQSLEEFLEREMGGFPENQPISGWQEEADRPYNKETPPKQRKPQTNRRELQADMLAPQYRQNASSGARETRPGSGAGKEAVSRREAVPAGAGAARNAAFRSRQPERPQRAASSSGHAPDRQEALEETARRRPAGGAPLVREEAFSSAEKRRPAKPAAAKKTSPKSSTRKRREQEREDWYEEDYDGDEDYDEREDDYEDDAEEDDRRNAPARRRKKKRRKSRLRRLLIGLLLLCLLIGGIWYYAVGRIYAKMTYHEIESLVNEPMKEDGVINILLIGNDSREAGEDGRSDAMILLSISSRTKTIHMMSLLRDMYVDIPGRQGNRLNAAYAFGGPELLMETLEQNLDLEVNRYVLVNFQAFANLVDAVGGVDLELSNEEVQYVNGYLTEYNNLEGRPEGTDYLDFGLSGMIHLNGPQALAYCRIRYIGSDFGRTERQRKVLSEVLHQAPKAVLTNPVGLMNGLLPNLTTNLTESECRVLSLQALSLLRYDIVQSSIPIQGSYSNASIRGMSVLDVDFEANKAFIRQNIYGE